MRPVNLLPEEQRPRRASGGQSGSAYVVVGVLGALLALLVVYVLSSNQVEARMQQAAQAEREAEAANARVAALGPFGNFAQVAQTRSASVAALAGGRFDWERLARELAHVLPADTWLTEVDASLVPGEDDAAIASAAPGGPTAKLVGCAKRQSDVAQVMVRLRQVHRVSDVTLNESAQDGEAGSSSGVAAPVPGPSSSEGEAGGCGGAYKFDVTAAFEPLAPIPGSPGARGVPARLGGGS